MIELEDQNQLFELISAHLKKDIMCYAFGGTAMMYYGYKNSTKDIDIVFESKNERDEFIRVIKYLGYKEKSPKLAYSLEKLMRERKNIPLMFTRGEERFDIFLKQIFKTKLSSTIKARIFARHDFTKKNTLFVNVIGKEDIILLKSVTSREKDLDDIRTILSMDSSIDWELITKEAVEQAKDGDKWVVLDLEEKMQQLKKEFLIKKKYFDILYSAV